MNIRPGYLSTLLCAAAAVTAAGLCGVIAPAPLQAQSEGEMTRQAIADFDRADAELNAVYTHLMRSLGPSDQKLLRDSQRAWLKFRDAEIKFRAARGQGGSLYPMLIATYEARLTRNRTKELREAGGTFQYEEEM